MFQAVRDWWSGGRGKITARLFVFEFFVVVAGVLVAQAVAEWAGDRSAMAEAERADTRISKELSHNLGKAKIWLAAIPCLRERMSAVIRLGPGEGLPTGSTVRPKVEPFLPIEQNDEQAGNYRVRFGDARADELREMQQELLNGNSNVDAIIHLWGRIMLVDPALGVVTDAHREHASVAAADLLAELRGMEIVMTEFVKRAHGWNIAPTYDRIGVPAERCEQIWQSNAIAIRNGGS